MSDANLHESDPIEQAASVAEAVVVPLAVGQSRDWTEEMLAKILGRLVVTRVLECDYREDWQIRRIVEEARAAATHGRKALQQQGRW